MMGCCDWTARKHYQGLYACTVWIVYVVSQVNHFGSFEVPVGQDPTATCDSG